MKGAPPKGCLTPGGGRAPFYPKLDPCIGSSGKRTGSAGAGARPRFDKVPSEVQVPGPELPVGGTEETFSVGSAGTWTGTAD